MNDERLFDLVRYERGELHTEGLITDEEYVVERLESFQLGAQHVVALQQEFAAYKIACGDPLILKCTNTTCGLHGRATANPMAGQCKQCGGEMSK